MVLVRLRWPTGLWWGGDHHFLPGFKYSSSECYLSLAGPLVPHRFQNKREARGFGIWEPLQSLALLPPASSLSSCSLHTLLSGYSNCTSGLCLQALAHEFSLPLMLFIPTHSNLLPLGREQRLSRLSWSPTFSLWCILTPTHSCNQLFSPLHAPPYSHGFKFFIFPTHVIILYTLVGPLFIYLFACAGS